MVVETSAPPDNCPRESPSSDRPSRHQQHLVEEVDVFTNKGLIRYRVHIDNDADVFYVEQESRNGAFLPTTCLPITGARVITQVVINSFEVPAPPPGLKR